MLRNCFLDFAVHWFGCRATEPGFTGDIGAIEVWLIDWFTIFLIKLLIHQQFPNLEITRVQNPRLSHPTVLSTLFYAHLMLYSQNSGACELGIVGTYECWDTLKCIMQTPTSAGHSLHCLCLIHMQFLTTYVTQCIPKDSEGGGGAHGWHWAQIWMKSPHFIH